MRFLLPPFCRLLCRSTESIKPKNLHRRRIDSPGPFGDLFAYLPREGNTQGGHVSPMTRDARIALFLIGELVAALRANDPDAFRQWLSGGVQDLGEVLFSQDSDGAVRCITLCRGSQSVRLSNQHG